jgi:hypothetical protein
MLHRPTTPAGTLFLSAALLLCTPILLAQTTAPPQASYSQKAQATGRLPDLSGIWAISATGRSWDPADPAGLKPEQLPMTPWAREKWNAARPPFGAKETFDNPNDPVERYCDPPGLTRLYNFPWQFTIDQTPTNVHLLFEYFRVWRTVAMDRPHPKDPDPTWLGDSVGHYEGDTLVIDTIGFNDKSWLDQVGHPHSDALHTVERLRRLGPDALQLELTIDDPKAYTKSFTSKRVFKASTVPLGETMCSVTEQEDFQKKIMDRTVTSPPAK